MGLGTEVRAQNSAVGALLECDVGTITTRRAGIILDCRMATDLPSIPSTIAPPVYEVRLRADGRGVDLSLFYCTRRTHFDKIAD